MATPTRRRSQALADTDDDVSTAAQGAARLADADPDKMVMVSIERDFKLTQDDGREVFYKAGIDEMPLSHAMHWWAKSHGGVALYIGKRATAEQKDLAEKQASLSGKPPEGDPEKLPKDLIPLTALSSAEVVGNPNLTPKT